jgi:aspartate kinase
MLVMKFGGTSIGTAKAIKQTAKVIKSKLGQDLIIVVSALAGVTNQLIDLANLAKDCKGYRSKLKEVEERHLKIIKQLSLDEKLISKEFRELHAALKGVACLKELTPRTLDKVMSVGEICSAKIVAAYLNKLDIEAKAHNSWEIGIETDSVHTKATLNNKSYQKIKKNLVKLKHVPVITGFIAKDDKGEVTTFGKGGSDLTAAIIGTALNVKEIQIWTDVNGVMTCDPKVCKKAKSINKMSFREAAELAYFGAKILHPASIQPAMKKNIPVIVKNTFNPSFPGTKVVCKKSGKTLVTGIALRKDITEITIESSRMLNAPGFMYQIFRVFHEEEASVDLVATSEVSVSLTLDEKSEHLEVIEKKLANLGKVSIKQNHSIICIVGDGVQDNPKLKGEIINTIAQANIPIKMISQGASSINIGIVVENKDAEKAVRLLHCRFVEG